MTRILLVNPPIYDFSAYDFWLRPYGMLQAAGMIRGRAEMTLFDFLDRAAAGESDSASPDDLWGRGKFPSRLVAKPPAFADIPRRFRRFGRTGEEFVHFLRRAEPFDFVFIQTVMTYWYPGVAESIAAVRANQPHAKIILGGVYATLCTDHAQTLGADLVVRGADYSALANFTGLEFDASRPALWEAYASPAAGIIKLTDGCPYACTYCHIPLVGGGFAPRATARVSAELELLLGQGVKNIAFYDDALLHQPDEALRPFLELLRQRGASVNLHTPNALHARLLTRDLAEEMVRSGFKTFFLGFESSSEPWQKQTGGKVRGEELAHAVEHLRSAGAEASAITAYILLGHPSQGVDQVEASMRFASNLGIRIMLSEFSPVPGTPDGEACGNLANLAEPLNHNKTALVSRALGENQANRLKDLCRKLNSNSCGD